MKKKQGEPQSFWLHRQSEVMNHNLEYPCVELVLSQMKNLEGSEMQLLSNSQVSRRIMEQL